jgi:hypothetical protein
MELDVYWQATRWLSLEHLRVRIDENGVHADGLIVGADAAPLRLRYQLACDRGWRATSLRITDLTSDVYIELQHRAGEGWRTAEGVEVAELAAAIDVDIAATPFTNTLPIRRLRLEPEQPQELTVVYVEVEPTLSVRAARQRYTRRAITGAADRFLYESLESDFARELVVDPNGLVVDYPGLWRRVGAHDDA